MLEQMLSWHALDLHKPLTGLRKLEVTSMKVQVLGTSTLSSV